MQFVGFISVFLSAQAIAIRVEAGGHRKLRIAFLTVPAPDVTRNKKLLGTSASLLVTSALLVVTRSY